MAEVVIDQAYFSPDGQYRFQFFDAIVVLHTPEFR